MPESRYAFASRQYAILTLILSASPQVSRWSKADRDTEISSIWVTVLYEWLRNHAPIVVALCTSASLFSSFRKPSFGIYCLVCHICHITIYARYPLIYCCHAQWVEGYYYAFGARGLKFAYIDRSHDRAAQRSSSFYPIVIDAQHWYKDINPNCKIPALTDGELAIFESSAVMCYLVEKYDLAHKISFKKGSDQYCTLRSFRLCWSA